MEKIKVVWICHFSNRATRAKLKILSYLFISPLVKFFTGTDVKNKGNVDIAPWVSGLIQEFEKYENIELHVISPQVGLKGLVSEFKIKDICYHFYSPDISFLLNLLTKNVAIWRKLQPASRIVNNIIRRIQPQIVHLIGAENYYHSCVVLDIKKLPILVSCQTIYSNPQRLSFFPQANQTKNWAIELLIHKNQKYFACGGRLHRDLLLKNNPEAIVFKAFFPTKMPVSIESNEIEFDFVCFAAVHGQKKGTIDTVKALASVKEIKPEVKLNIVGKCPQDVRDSLNKLIDDLGIKKNVYFNDYFPAHEDMFKQILKAKFAVLPSKLDVISTTIREAMHLGLPVITYKTSGTPMLNSEKECVLIAELGDVNNLAEKMINLLQSKILADTLRRNAKEFFNNNYNNSDESLKLVETYHAVINHYSKGFEIPQALLFNLDKHPLY